MARAASKPAILIASRAIGNIGCALALSVAACAGGGTTTIIVVVTATPLPAVTPSIASPIPSASTSTPAGSVSPPIGGTATGGAQSGVGDEQLAVARANSYYGVQWTVDEARSSTTSIYDRLVPDGGQLVAVHVRASNPNAVAVSSPSSFWSYVIKLQLPSGESIGYDFMGAGSMGSATTSVGPQQSLDSWVVFRVPRKVPLSSLGLAFVSGNEAPTLIPFSGPEQVHRSRSWDINRSTDMVDGLAWSVSNGTLSRDIANHQANLGQEYIVLQFYVTNPRNSTLRRPSAMQYLRIEADNGVTLQPSEELSRLPMEFLPAAQLSAQYAWQIPEGSINPAVIILGPNGTRARIELGPLPPQ